MQQKVERMAASRIECISVRPSQGIPSSTHAPITVLFKGRRYCLTRMGFGLNVAPSIMKTIVNAILTKDKCIQRATSAYIDDMYVNESIVPAARVKEHLYSFGLHSKELERLQHDARGLGLKVWGEDNFLLEKREQNPRHALCRHATEHIFTMWQIGWAPSHKWLASCSCSVHQAESL